MAKFTSVSLFERRLKRRERELGEALQEVLSAVGTAVGVGIVDATPFVTGKTAGSWRASQDVANEAVIMRTPSAAKSELFAVFSKVRSPKTALFMTNPRPWALPLDRGRIGQRSGFVDRGVLRGREALRGMTGKIWTVL